ncbi:putative ring finger protein [Erysiphe neolycopersici]|uniref:Putative ring finger protein n=1 Tax=Erysiphe neolycopersici TaxID=212602 RepID=A0A420HDW2_9PEZI|nr:putative ring finger protein [Erysiphe neolycopersici]
MARIYSQTSGGTDFQIYSSEQNSPQSSLVDPPASPSRARLRSLNYLRTYRQNTASHTSSGGHVTNHDVNQMRPIESREGRSTSYIPPPRVVDSSRNTKRSTLKTSEVEKKTSREIPVHASCHEGSGTTSGWLPTVRGQSGVSRIASEPQATATASSSAVLSTNSISIESLEISSAMPHTLQPSTGGNISEMSRQNIREPNTSSGETIVPTPVNRLNSQGLASPLPSIRFLAHQDPRALRPSLVFTPMLRILPSGKEVIKVGRYSDKDIQPVHTPNTPSSAPIGFKSKVVSRRHCEFWCYAGSWFIKDVKSSSGTFLNHIRLSAPGTESKPFPVHDGDIVQLGIDFKGGEEMIFRCVKIRIELNKGWQTGPSSFNMQSHKRLCELNSLGKATSSRPSQDCSICLCPIAPCQPLFVAPCSHTWHYKCIRVIINGPHWPHFICPNCRSIADLEAELEETCSEELEEAKLEKKLIEDTNNNESSVHMSWTIDNSSRLDSSSGMNGLQQIGIARPSSQLLTAIRQNLSEADTNLDCQPLSGQSHRLEYLQIDQASASSSPSVAQNLEIALSPINTTTPRESTEANQLENLASHRLQTLSLENIELVEAVTSPEVPLTPTNNLGPFVFDGNDSSIQPANISPLSFVAADVAPDHTISNSAM